MAGAQSSVDALVGSWAEEIVATTPDGTPAPIPPLRGLVTFHADNTMAVTFTEAAITPPPPRATNGHGVWAARGSSTYAETQVFYRVNELGIYDRTVTLQGQLSLAADGNSWSGTWATVTTDGSGARIGTNQGTHQGSRIQLQT